MHWANFCISLTFYLKEKKTDTYRVLFCKPVNPNGAALFVLPANKFCFKCVLLGASEVVAVRY